MDFILIFSVSAMARFNRGARTEYSQQIPILVLSPGLSGALADRGFIHSGFPGHIPPNARLIL
jgi:hypothetical protein